MKKTFMFGEIFNILDATQFCEHLTYESSRVFGPTCELAYFLTGSFLYRCEVNSRDETFNCISLLYIASTRDFMCGGTSPSLIASRRAAAVRFLSDTLHGISSQRKNWLLNPPLAII